MDISPAYLLLIQRLPLRPIRSDKELTAAQDLVDELLDGPALSGQEHDYLDVLSILIEEYENKVEHAFSISDLSDSDFLAHLLEAKGITQAKFSAETGIAESTLSAVLNHKRRLTREQVTILKEYIGMKPSK